MNLEKKPISSRTSLKIKFVSERLKQFCSSRFFRFYLLYFGYCSFFGIKMGTESFNFQWRVYEDVGLTLLNTPFTEKLTLNCVNQVSNPNTPNDCKFLNLRILSFSTSAIFFLQNRKENQVLNLPRNSFEMSSHK